MVHGCHPHLEFFADAGVSHQNGDDGQGVLDQDAAEGIEQAATLVGPLFQAIVDGADGRIGDGDVVVLERADDEERQGQNDAQDLDAAQGQQGARWLEAFLSRVDDQLVTVEGDGRDGQRRHENGNGLQRAHHLARDGRIDQWPSVRPDLHQLK
jgi:hypothetical protein